MFGILIALLSGALMSIQGVFNTEVTKASSVWVAAGFVQLTAFLTCVAAWLFTGREPVLAFWQVEPKYMLLGGVMELFGLFGMEKAAFEWHKLLGLVISIVGIIIFKW